MVDCNDRFTTGLALVSQASCLGRARETCYKRGVVVFEPGKWPSQEQFDWANQETLLTVQKRAKQQHSCQYSLQEADLLNPTCTAAMSVHSSATFLIVIWTKSYNKSIIAPHGSGNNITRKYSALWFCIVPRCAWANTVTLELKHMYMHAL